MTRAKRVLMLALAVTIAAASVVVVRVRAELDHAHELGKRVRCACGGCEQSAGTCYHVGGAFSGPCETAKMMIAEIQKHLNEGMSDDQVIAAMIKEYGPTAYVEPPKTGFGLVAWFMPGVYLLLGGLVVVFVISRWRKRGVVAEASVKETKQVPPEVLARARAMAERAIEE